MSELKPATLYVNIDPTYKYKGARTPGGEVQGIRLPDGASVLPEVGSLFETLPSKLAEGAMLAIRNFLLTKRHTSKPVNSLAFGVELACWRLDPHNKELLEAGVQAELLPHEGVPLIGHKSFVSQEGGVYGVVKPGRYLVGMFLGTGRQNRSLGVDGGGRLIYGATDAFLRTFPGAQQLTLHRVRKPPQSLLALPPSS